MLEKTFVAGIAGGTASGKSTLCEKLENALKDYKLFVIHMDGYFKPDKDRPHPKAFVTQKEYSDHNHPESFYLNKLNTDLEEIISKNEYEIIIIEGLLTLWDDNIYNKLDLKIFVDCKADERIVRRLKRNMAWGLTFDEISSVYLDMVRYRHEEYVEPSKYRADIIINGSNPTDISLEVLTEYIKNKIKHGERL
ncbi:MAG: AAA family ATPase [Oscillospiraceae bacterium]|nr:AAA family ATPase [Oscillospiraceae bacterium]